MSKKVIRLTEADIEKIVRQVISEQNITQNPDRTALLKQLEDKIISFIEEKQKNDFLTKIKISVDFVETKIDNNSPQWVRASGFNMKPVVTITDGNDSNILSQQLSYIKTSSINSGDFAGYQGYAPKAFDSLTDGRGIGTYSGLVIGNFINEIIGKDKTLKQFYENEPGIKEQVDSIPIRYFLYLRDPNGNRAKIMVAVEGESGWNKLVDTIKRTFAPKRLSKQVTQGNTTTMAKAFHDKGDTEFFYRLFDMGDFKTYLEIAPMTMVLDTVSLRGAFAEIIGEPDTPIPPPITAPRRIKLDLVDVFNYDKITLKNEEDYLSKLEDFKISLNDGLKRINGFKDFLNGQTLTVYGYASQDANPDDADGGTFVGCETYGKGKGPRKDYNVCLSNARAEKVKNDIQTIFTDLGLTTTINSVGKGETTQWGGNGWSDKIKDNETDLSNNRRVTFDIPEYKTRQ